MTTAAAPEPASTIEPIEALDPPVSADVLRELRLTWTPQPEPDGAGRAARHRLAEATRRLIEAVKSVDPEDAESTLESVADDVSDLADRIALLARVGDGTPTPRDLALHERSPLIGAANPLAPPMRITGDGPLVRAHATFGAAYEGPYGRVHGGYVAAAFDEVMGCAQSGAGTLGMTGWLTVRMRRATPLYTRIDYEAGVTRVEGRKAWVTARSYADGVLVADAEALFIRPARA
ncbi:PaaI family thioesterase [Embleya scabrispora]|uniref:PaaI family thioesterase n=1 Tax=Embleya scabrispora TaxID=159449 RepID=UPI00036D26A0|nr:PaaI family thioesterase [Embleya scabrispora]MYS85733.1 PaaI family thioesterase [Streptomyces sp. SID5474]